MYMCERILKAAQKYAQASTLTDNQTLKKTKEDTKKTHKTQPQCLQTYTFLQENSKIYHHY